MTESNVERPFRAAVALPCYNEAAALTTVITGWRDALPDAEIIVFDNNSTDGTPQVARALGVRVVRVAAQGKGHVVRAIFATLADRDAVILVDGDGTYPADHIGPLLSPIRDGSADMTVGLRRPVSETGALTPIRQLGNILIRSAFRILIGRGSHHDLLSGYRVFSPSFLRSFKPRSTGFEIETEIACEAVARKLRVVEIPVPYYPRIAGTTSKIRAVRDGLRILRTILQQSLRLRPWRLAVMFAGFLVGVGMIVLLLKH